LERFWLATSSLGDIQLSSDPLLVDKVRDIVGLCLSPPNRALVLSVDEKSQIQALDREQPVLPMMPGVPERRTPSYIRHGTTSLFAALDIASGFVIGKCHKRHRAAEFLDFLRQIDARVPDGLDVHIIIMDNYATHKTAAIKTWLARRPTTTSNGLIGGQGVFFDIFRFEEGMMVEHWLFSAPAAPPNESGHTQTDGPTEAKNLQDTEKNKSFLREYYETFHIAGDHSKSRQYFAGDYCVRHEPGVRDGVGAFLHDVEQLMQHRTIDELKFLLGQGDFVFIAAKGTHEDEPSVYVDLYRVEDEKIVEHWGFPQKVPPQRELKNPNGML
jgi:predicted SnoaL-like aldol condensation-catalyzing enzyme